MNLINRIFKLIKRKVSASEFGLSFAKASKWKLPKSIMYKGKQYSIFADDEHGTGTRDAFRDIFIDDEYQLKKIIKKISVKTIVDVGGHSGFFSMYCKLLLPNAKVHCYEPNPELRDYIINQAKQVNFDYFPEAVGMERGYVKLMMGSQSINTTTNLDDSGPILQSSLRDCISRIGGEIDILKLDCEGAEWDIFRDINSFRNIKAITMEYHLTNGKKIDDLRKAIDLIGFEIIMSKFTGPEWGILLAYNRAL